MSLIVLYLGIRYKVWRCNIIQDRTIFYLLSLYQVWAWPVHKQRRSIIGKKSLENTKTHTDRLNLILSQYSIGSSKYSPSTISLKCLTNLFLQIVTFLFLVQYIVSYIFSGYKNKWSSSTHKTKDYWYDCCSSYYWFYGLCMSYIALPGSNLETKVHIGKILRYKLYNFFIDSYYMHAHSNYKHNNILYISW